MQIYWGEYSDMQNNTFEAKVVASIVREREYVKMEISSRSFRSVAQIYEFFMFQVKSSVFLLFKAPNS